MYAQRIVVAVTTDASGDATAYSPHIPFGVVSQIRYVKTDFADGVDFAITLEATGEGVWTESNVNASATRAPRQAAHGTDGVASGGAELIALADDRIKIVVAQGGDTKTGAFHFVLV